MSFQEFMTYLILFLVFFAYRNFSKAESRARKDRNAKKLDGNKSSFNKSFLEKNKGMKNSFEKISQAKVSTNVSPLVSPLPVPIQSPSKISLEPVLNQSPFPNQNLLRLVLCHEIMSKPKSLRDSCEY